MLEKPDLSAIIQPRDDRPTCHECGRPQRKDCNGRGWLEALGPYHDGSYITSRPCPND
jgi:hypothetical protein